MVNSPAAFVNVPFELPFCKTLTPVKGLFCSSEIIPVTVFSSWNNKGLLANEEAELIKNASNSNTFRESKLFEVAVLVLVMMGRFWSAV